MAWAIAAFALALLGLGWWWGRGRGGELPAQEDRRPQPRIPEGEFTTEDVAALSFATARKGYSPRAVDALLAKVEATLDDRSPLINGAVVAASRFGVELGGYDMEQVDLVLDRLSRQLGFDQPTAGHQAASAESPLDEPDTEPVDGADPDPVQASEPGTQIDHNDPSQQPELRAQTRDTAE